MKLILLGAPGAGKGTQAENICKRLGIPAISTGNMIREAIKNKTEMGLQAVSYTEKGQLVPDEVVIGIIKARLSQKDCDRGYLLDGFPRTIPQAMALEEMGMQVDTALSIEVSDDEIEKRMTGRRVCECGATYHIINNPPKTEGVCDRCGKKLTVRKDDSPETVRDRLRVYHEQTEPLKEFYGKLGKLKTVEGVGSLEKIRDDIFAVLAI